MGMLVDTNALENLHKQFVEKVIEKQTVWTLVHNDEMALFDSQLYDDVAATPFFSSTEAAGAMITDEWADFKIAAITLPTFLEKWLIALYNQDVMVAAIWNDVATGKEFEPLELLLEFLDTLQQGHIPIQFENYYSLTDFINKVKEFLKD